MGHAHAEATQCAEEGHFFGDDLSGADERNRFFAMLVLDGFHPQAKDLHRGIPVDLLHFARGIAEQGSGRAIGRRERRQRFPTFRASHAKVYRIIMRRGDIDRLAIAQVNVQTAASRTKAADDVRRVVRL
jgi:hypothetical protein